MFDPFMHDPVSWTPDPPRLPSWRYFAVKALLALAIAGITGLFWMYPGHPTPVEKIIHIGSGVVMIVLLGIAFVLLVRGRRKGLL